MNKDTHTIHTIDTTRLQQSLSPTESEFHTFLDAIELPQKKVVHMSPYSKIFVGAAFACSLFIVVSVYSYNNPTILFQMGAYDRALSIETQNVQSEIMLLSNQDDILNYEPLATEEELAML